MQHFKNAAQVPKWVPTSSFCLFKNKHKLDPLSPNVRLKKKQGEKLRNQSG